MSKKQPKQKPTPTAPPPNLVFCKSCGEAIDVSADPDGWPLQCDACVAGGVKLPKGYE